MTDKVSFELVSPERLLMAADVASVIIPGSEGDFTFLPDHAPIISTIRPAVVDVFETEGDEPTRIFVRGGFVDGAMNRLTILAEEAIHVVDLDREALELRIANATEDLEDAKTDKNRHHAELMLGQLKDLLNALD